MLNFFFKKKVYDLKINFLCYSHGRLPNQAKDIYKFIRNNQFNLLKNDPGLIGKNYYSKQIILFEQKNCVFV
jgi:hypothetical protein